MPKATPIDTAMIERATRFDATIFLGVGKFRTEHFDTLAAARKRAPAMVAEVANGRKVMIYAITPEGRSTFVPDSYQPTEGAPKMELAANLSAVDIAKLTALLTGGGGYKRANSKEAAIRRFRNVAAEKGIDNPDRYLDGDLDFDTAQHVLFERLKGGHASIPEVKEAAAATEQEAGPDTMEAEAEATTKSRRGPVMANGREIVRDEKGFGVPGPAPKPAEAAKAGKRAAIAEAAANGMLPPEPDFSAETHKRFRPKLEKVVAMVKAGDIAGLEAFEINPVSSSPKAIAKYRDLAVIALKARAAKAEASKGEAA